MGYVFTSPIASSFRAASTRPKYYKKTLPLILKYALKQSLIYRGIEIQSLDNFYNKKKKTSSRKRLSEQGDISGVKRL